MDGACQKQQALWKGSAAFWFGWFLDLDFFLNWYKSVAISLGKVGALRLNN